jgi:hypothetical protein
LDCTATALHQFDAGVRAFGLRPHKYLTLSGELLPEHACCVFCAALVHPSKEKGRRCPLDYSPPLSLLLQ